MDHVPLHYWLSVFGYRVQVLSCSIGIAEPVPYT